MSVIRFFPEKDTTLYTEYNTLNAGIDEILDLSKLPSLTFPSYSSAARAIIKFSNDDILGNINDIVGTSTFSASLGLYLANASKIPVTYSLELAPLYEDWDMGTGRFSNVPTTTNGASWAYKDTHKDAWKQTDFTGSSIPYTASFFSGNPGGGSYYTSLLTTQSFDNRSSKDIYIDATPSVQAWFANTIPNNGFILKNSFKSEFDPTINYTLMYFSGDTNTIYPPFLDIKWDDSIYAPFSGSFLMQTPNVVITLANNKGEYERESVQRFDLNVREQYPQRMFVTSSMYTSSEYLPFTAYWRLRDNDTDNIVIDFDTDFTKISTDQVGSFFIIYMNMLEPERYYRFEFRVDFDGETLIFDDNYYFKVKR